MRLISFAALTISLLIPTSTAASNDPCSEIAPEKFFPPRAIRACMRSFPFNETLRQNVLQAVSRMFDLHIFQDYYLNLEPPFHESSVNIRERLAEINRTRYHTDYDFNMDLFNFMRQLNDFNTVWFPRCYTATVLTFLPTPIISIAENGHESLYIAPETAEWLHFHFGNFLTGYYDSINFDWKSLVGAKILKIEDQDPYVYLDRFARKSVGKYLDHGIRINAALSTYIMANGGYAISDSPFIDRPDVQEDSVKMRLKLVGSTRPVTVEVPFASILVSNSFTDGPSYWAVNCIATKSTNEMTGTSAPSESRRSLMQSKVLARGMKARDSVYPPPEVVPPNVVVNDDFFRSFILPDNKTGVLSIPVFALKNFQEHIVTSFNTFKTANVSQLIIDLSHNSGSDFCLAQFLHAYLSGGSHNTPPGFISAYRSSPLARKIVEEEIKLGLVTSRTANNFRFLNGTQMPANYNYLEPSREIKVNGRIVSISQPLLDTCELKFTEKIPDEPPIDLRNIVIVSNGVCSGACAEFHTLMFERHNTTSVVLGGRLGQGIQYKAMTAEDEIEWSALKQAIRATKLEDDPLSPDDLLVSAELRVAARAPWSWTNPLRPTEYQSEYPHIHIPYTKDTYNNPLQTWTSVAEHVFNN